MLNLNKIFPWLSIRNKLLIAFAGLSFFPLALVGVYSILSNAGTMKRIALGDLTDNVESIREKSENFMEGINSDLRVLQNSSFVGAWEQNVSPSRRRASQSDLDRLATELLVFARTKEIYYQFRLIDEGGDELLRIECEHPNDSLKSYHIVAPVDLRQNRETYYFMLANSVSSNQIGFAPAELLGHGHERIPVISFAVPLVDHHRRKGILIANVFERKLIELIERQGGPSPTRTVALVTGDGHYLYRSDMRKDWNRLLATWSEDNLDREYPPAVLTSILSGSEGTAVEGMKDIVGYAPLFRTGTTSRGGEVTSSFAVPIIVLVSESADVIFGPVRTYAATYAGFLLVFLFAAVALGLVATRQITRPIGELHRGAEVIAQGNYTSPLRVETHDEIEKLADQFNSMAASLKEHELEIQRHRTRLEEMVAQRTHELLEEKGKLQAVLDNVPSAFVLLDSSFRIQTVSAAFASVAGIELDDVDRNGRFTLVGEVNGSTDDPWTRAASTGEIETHVQQIEREGSSTRFLEYTAIPMKAGENVHAVIVIMTDITKRKNFEKQLVQTEKLMAAGEMSSIIAHEFRNALTSVKMIIQLSVESNTISRNEKKSLGVALDSIHHMETIVTELLDFARPKPLQLAETDLNRIVGECLDFVNPHVQQHGIKVTVSLDRKIKRRPLDGSKMKEAIINLLLNSIQAQDGKEGPVVRGQIDITTRQVKLRETMRDVAYAESISPTDGTGEGTEIVLERNAECAMVEIRDNGKGIGKDERRRVFDPFYTTKTNGTGLGLPMVKRTVVAHGGIVAVESAPGKGTTFRIYLPMTYAN